MGAENNWQPVSLNEVAEIVCGGTPSTSVAEYWHPAEIDWVTAKDVSECSTAKIHSTERCISRVGFENSSAKMLPPLATVLIARGATMGKCRMIAHKMALNQTCYGIIAKSSADPRYIYYSLSRLYDYFRAISHGSVFDTVIGSGLRSTPIPFPPLPEQRAIAHILGTLDDKIELNRRMNETLEAMAQALFQSWFVDFDPVRAKMEGRRPAGMDEETVALFPVRFDKSAVEEIPEGWQVQRLGEVARINERSITRDYSHQNIEYVDISSVAAGRLEATTRYELDHAPSRAKRLVSHGDTIWSCVRPNRKSYLFIHRPLSNLVVSTGFAVLSPIYVPPSYLYAWVTTDQFVEYLTYSADGSAYPAVRPDRFADAEILVPPRPLLEKFEQIAGPMRDQIAHNEHESRALAALRDALLPKLLSGELRVKETSGYLESSPMLRLEENHV